MSDSTSNSESRHSRRQIVGLVVGAVCFAVLLGSPAPGDLGTAGWRTAAVAALMAIWWVSEAIPLSATALVPLVLFPLLDISPIRAAATPYANPVILLMLGGFILALGMQRWSLHKRIALLVVSRVGNRPAHTVGGFMLASALVSMWVFNTTTAVMMVPIALSVIEVLLHRGAGDERHAAAGRDFATALMIAIAYGATIGGMGTLIGTAPNAVLAGFMAETYGFEISFVDWMRVGIPMVAVLLPLTWWVLVRVAIPLRRDPLPGQAEVLADELAALGQMSRGERIVAAVVAGTAFLWVFRPIVDRALPGLHLNDTSIALLGAVVLFLVPVNWKRGVFALSGDWARELPWGVLVLFGGGLSLAAGIKQSGLAAWIGASVGGLASLPPLAAIAGIVVLLIFLTELTSNTATTATFLPIVASIALGLGENPLLFVFPAVLAANCAFMMPVATPPNAVVFASGYIRIEQLMRAGIWANAIGALVSCAMAYTVVRWVFAIERGVVPAWASAP